MDAKIIQLIEKLSGKEDQIEHLRLLLISEKSIFRVYNGFLSYERGHSIAFKKLDNIDRGEILEQFSRVEFLLTELLHLVLLGYKSENSDILDSITERMMLGRLINVMSPRIISKTLKNKLDALVSVRNGLAHHWSDNEVMYKKGYLPKKEVLEAFKNDFNSVWTQLMNLYKKEQNKIDIEEIIKSIS